MTTNQIEARALGDPTRYAIFSRIAEAANPISVKELNEEFAFNHNAIRQHLAKLVAAGAKQDHGGRPQHGQEAQLGDVAGKAWRHPVQSRHTGAQVPGGFARRSA